MSQTDSFHIPNLAGAPFRNLLNQILDALSKQNAGSTEPPNPFSGMVWLDTSSNPAVFKQRNESNTGWIKIFTADNPPTKAQVGLSNVPNYRATASLTDGSSSKLLLASAGKNLQDNKLDKTNQAYDSARLGNKLASQYVLISGTYANLRAQATTKGDVGLGSVQNYGITSSLTSNNSRQYLSAKGAYELNQMKVNKTVTINGKPLSSNVRLTAANVDALPASGGNLGGYINYTSDTGDILKLDGKTFLRRISKNGGVSMGADDALIIGCGEARQTMEDNVSETSELVHIGSDGAMNFYTNLQNGWAARKTFTLEADGSFKPANVQKTQQNLGLSETLALKYGVLSKSHIPRCENIFYTNGVGKANLNDCPPGLDPLLAHPDAPNSPPVNVYHYITTYLYGNDPQTANKTQVATPYNGGSVWTRYRFSNTWSSWQELAPTSAFLKPTPGRFVSTDSAGRAHTLPAGGTWCYWMHGINSTRGDWYGNSISGVAAGGTTVLCPSGDATRGFAWRIS